MVNSVDFENCYNYDRVLIDDIRKKVNTIDKNDHLFSELIADAVALDLLDVVLNYTDDFRSKRNLDKFVYSTKEMLENFYAFNTITYELYQIWSANIRLLRGQISENVYRQVIHTQDINDIIRGNIFPLILWEQIDRILYKKYHKIIVQKEHPVKVRSEMINFFNLAYNTRLKNVILLAENHNFHEKKLTITEARDILIEWKELDSFAGASAEDLFLGDPKDEDAFFMFIRGY